MYLYRPDVLKRCVIFAMIYEGTSNFTEVQGRVTVDDGRGSEITVVMNAPHPRLTFCAVCLLESEGGALKVQKEEMYFSGHPECDKHYGFGFRWVAGSK
jgi:tellurite resistance protein TerA